MIHTRIALHGAIADLAAAGVESPAADARILLAAVLQVEPARLVMIDQFDSAQHEQFLALVQKRASRVPVQHLTGRAYFRHVELLVGPGVFVPRPETEVMTGWAIDQLRAKSIQGQRPVVVELCAGSGAITKALADELGTGELHAVELSEDAARYAAENLAGLGVDLRVGDMATAFPDLDGQVDLVIANPPYIPLEAYESVAPEARDHDPLIALFSGDDGLEAMRVVAKVAARLLRPGGLVCAEHAEVQVSSAPEVFVAAGHFDQVRDHQDLNSRPRFVTAVRR